MGEAKRRGTFEERQLQAIAEGRVKSKFRRPTNDWGLDGLLGMMKSSGLVAAVTLALARKRHRLDPNAVGEMPN